MVFLDFLFKINFEEIIEVKGKYEFWELLIIGFLVIRNFGVGGVGEVVGCS